MKRNIYRQGEGGGAWIAYTALPSADCRPLTFAVSTARRRNNLAISDASRYGLPIKTDVDARARTILQFATPRLRSRIYRAFYFRQLSTLRAQSWRTLPPPRTICPRTCLATSIFIRLIRFRRPYRAKRSNVIQSGINE